MTKTLLLSKNFLKKFKSLIISPTNWFVLLSSNNFIPKSPSKCLFIMMTTFWHKIPWFRCPPKATCQAHGYRRPSVELARPLITHLDPPSHSPMQAINMIKWAIKWLRLALNATRMVKEQAFTKKLSKDLHTSEGFIRHQLRSSHTWANLEMTTLHGKSTQLLLIATPYRTHWHSILINSKGTQSRGYAIKMEGNYPSLNTKSPTPKSKNNIASLIKVDGS